MNPIPGFQLPEVAALIDAGKLTVTDAAMSENFARFIEGHYPFLPVTGYSIDWSQVPDAVRLRWDETIDRLNVADFLYGTPLVRHQFTAVWYGRSQPCVVGKFYHIAYNLELLVPPGLPERYLFGIDGVAPDLEPTFADFVELAGAGWLSAPRT
jgi:hypothetical protein